MTDLLPGPRLATLPVPELPTDQITPSHITDATASISTYKRLQARSEVCAWLPGRVRRQWFPVSSQWVTRAPGSTYFGIDGKARSPSGEKRKDNGEVPSIPFGRACVEIRAVSQQQPFKGSSSVTVTKRRNASSQEALQDQVPYGPREHA